MRIQDPESFWPWIWDGKNLDPGLGINIPDPKHCYTTFITRLYVAPAAGNNVAEPVLHPGVLRLSLHTVQQGLGQRVHQNQAPNILQENWKKFI